MGMKKGGYHSIEFTQKEFFDCGDGAGRGAPRPGGRVHWIDRTGSRRKRVRSEVIHLMKKETEAI
jgi:hypothetical protein